MNKNENIEKKVIICVKKIIGNKYKKVIISETNLNNELNFDSLDLIRLIMELESCFSINIIQRSDEIELDNINTIQDIVKLIESFME